MKFTGKAIGTVAIIGVGAIGRAGTTVGGSALGGGVTVATLGTASPAGLPAAAGGVTACGLLAAGAGKVAEEVWNQ